MILLGSQSPRRRELLSGLDIEYQCVRIDCEEVVPADLQGADIPLYLANLKADAFQGLRDDDILITADTIVWSDGRMFGKPHDANDARNMLKQLSGREHEVITGVCITTTKQKRIFSVTTKVRFAALEDTEIDYYIEYYRPFDKAGAYGVQEWIGYIGVESIEGSYYNVMGLPVQRLYRELKEMQKQCAK